MNNRKQSIVKKDNALIWEGMIGHQYSSEQELIPGEDVVRRGPGNKIYVYRPVTRIVVPEDDYILINAKLSDDGTTVIAYVERKADVPGNQAVLKFDADTGNIQQHQDLNDLDTTIMPDDPDATRLDWPDKRKELPGLDR